jgi:hypothetical protein
MRAVGLANFAAARTAFGMSADVSSREIAVAYAVLFRQLPDESDLAYGLDLFDRIEAVRRKRNAYFIAGKVNEFRHYEKLRNEYIDLLSGLIERAGKANRVAH